MACASASSRHPCAIPVDKAAKATRPESSSSRNCAKPRPRSPTRFAAGTRHPSKYTGRVSEARQPTLEYSGPTSMPGVPGSTAMHETSSGPVAAVVMIRSVIDVPALVMKHFAPSITHSPPSRRARVSVRPASDPPLGSVSANAHSPSPAARLGSQRRRCSSVPNFAIASAPSVTDASTVTATDESTRAISSSARHSMSSPASAPPCSSGSVTPKTPSLPRSRTRSAGKTPRS